MATLLPAPDLFDRPQRLPCPDTEQILVWAIRRWHLHGAISREIEAGFLALCGIAEVECGLAAFDQLMAVLGRYGRRQMVIGGVRGAFSLDERAILTLLAVHQHGLTDHTRALLSWLVPLQWSRSVSSNAETLAGILARAGQILQEP